MPKSVTGLNLLHLNRLFAAIFLTAILSKTGNVYAASLYDDSALNSNGMVAMECSPVSMGSTFSAFLRGFDAKSTTIDSKNWSSDAFARLSITTDASGIGKAEFSAPRTSRIGMASIQGLSAAAVLGLSNAAVEVFSNRLTNNQNDAFSASAVVINRKYALLGAYVAAFHDEPVIFFCADSKSGQVQHDADSLNQVLMQNAGEIQAGVETLRMTLNGNQLALLDQLTKAEGSRARTLFPNLQNILKSTGLYDARSGALISGVNVRMFGTAVVATAATIQALRILTIAITKNPELAAIALPLPDTKGIAIDVNTFGMTVGEAKEFVSQSGAIQAKRCQQDSKVKTLCKVLSAIDFEVAYAQGNGA